MTQPLNDLIISIRDCDDQETKQYLITSEKARIRNYLRDPSVEMLPRVVSKLVFLNLLGENVQFGLMECIHLMGHELFSYKRVGYICTSILLEQQNEISVMATQIINNDLASNDVNCIYYALVFVANLGNEEICRSAATIVKMLFERKEKKILKAAGAAASRIIETNPDLYDSFKNSVQLLLNNPNHCVIISGINLALKMIKIDPKLIHKWCQFTKPFTMILKNLNQSRPTSEFGDLNVNDPFLQIKIMKALSSLKHKNEELDSVLQMIISSVEIKQNTGRAILYQAAETILAVSDNSSLRGLAFNQIGRLLSVTNANILYSALSSFAQVLSNRIEIENSDNISSIDLTAIQRYKPQIIQCLNHQDPSIRRRALYVITSLIDENNIKTLVPNILNYSKLSDSDFRTDMISKIYVAVEKYSDSMEWSFDIIEQLIIENDGYISTDIISSFCEHIFQNSQLQEYAVKKLSGNLINFKNNQTFVQICSYVLGEFAQMDDNNLIETFINILTLPQTDVETKLYILTALSKLASRFGKTQETIDVMKNFMTDRNLIIQQRAGELSKLLSNNEFVINFLAPIPSTNENENNSIEVSKNTKEDEVGNNLLEMMIGSNNNQTSMKSKSTNLLDDLLSGYLDVQQQNVNIIHPPSPDLSEIIKSNNYIIYGQTKVNPNAPNQYALKLTVVSNTTLTNFLIQFNPGNGWKINVLPPDGTILQKEKMITQVIYLLDEFNTPLQLNYQISYIYGSQPVVDKGTIVSIPMSN